MVTLRPAFPIREPVPGSSHVLRTGSRLVKPPQHGGNGNSELGTINTERKTIIHLPAARSGNHREDRWRADHAYRASPSSK